jgi:hypothetical protein
VNQKKKLKKIWGSAVCTLKEKEKCNLFGTKEVEKNVNTRKIFGIKWKDALEKIV